jgi:hypothetical protein
MKNEGDLERKKVVEIQNPCCGFSFGYGDLGGHKHVCQFQETGSNCAGRFGYADKGSSLYQNQPSSD